MSHLRFLWRYADTQTTELGSALGLGLCWGVWLLLPFNSLSGLAVYQPMLRLMPEPGWGVLFGILGLFQAFAVARQSYRLRFIAAYTSFAAWLFILIMFYLGNVVSLGIAFYVLFVIGSGWVVWRRERRWGGRAKGGGT
jgi:hypothetical protein